MKTDELEGVLRGLDPARDAPPLASPERREHDRLTIRSSLALLRGSSGQKRVSGHYFPGVVAGTLGAVVAIAVVVVVVAGSFIHAPAPAAFRAVVGMPDALAFTAADRRPSAADELERIAARTAGRSEPTNGTQHISYTGWDLLTTVGGGRTTSIVVPTRTELVRRADGSATLTTVHTKPLLRTPGDVEAWNREGRPGELERPETMTDVAFAYPGTAPSETAALRAYLQQGHPPENGPAETVVAVNDLVREQVLGPAQRAAVLRVLAGVPGLQYAGETTDRAGRKAEAFTLRSSHGGLRNDLTLVVDPATGRILDQVELLLEAGKLNIKVPAVIGYTSYD